MAGLTNELQTVIDLTMSHYQFAIGICVASLATGFYTMAHKRTVLLDFGMQKKIVALGSAGVSGLTLFGALFTLLWNHQTLINRVRNGKYSVDDLYGDSIYLVLTGIGLLALAVFYWICAEEK